MTARPKLHWGLYQVDKTYRYRFLLRMPDGVVVSLGGDRLVRDWLKATYRKGYVSQVSSHFLGTVIVLTSDVQAIMFKMRWQDAIIVEQTYERQSHEQAC